MSATVHKYLMVRLYNQSRKLHKKAHRKQFFKDLFKGEISIESYVGLLRCFAIVIGILEKSLTDSIHLPQVKTMLDGYQLKYPLLLKDLEAFDPVKVKNVMPAVRTALGIADTVMLRKETNPMSLLGYLYIIEGSTQGGSVLKPYIKQLVRLDDDNGLNYFSVYGKEVKNKWNTFSKKMNALDISPEIELDIISASSEFFESLIEVYDQLHPYDEKDLAYHIVSFNPEAGNHPLPTNPIEIAASIKAGDRCWQLFPYYKIRYGDRGHRYTKSDCVWLATLAKLQEENLIQQVDWLANVLANRGMPSVMLQIQLELLFEELKNAIPKKEKQYRNLLIGAAHLKQKQDNVISREQSDQVIRTFDAHVDIENYPILTNSGCLVVSAIADKKNTIPETEHTYLKWLLKSNRISKDMEALIEETVENLN